jgi:hypothetical protein
MMRIRHMRVRVLHGFVFVRVAVGTCGRYIMRMQVVSVCLFGVMAVGMFMFQNFMRMWVAV